MIECYCRTGMFEQCEKIDPKPPIVRLKWESEQTQRFPDFFKFGDKYMVYNKGFVKKLVNQPTNSPLRQACGLFSRNGDIISQAFIDDWYDGDWSKAMELTGSFNTLYKYFCEFFEYKRRMFMKKTNAIIDKGIENGSIKFKKNRTPASHGGVANLLKVLTKTMQEQGNSIYTIAKTQYLICIQAGIYVPDEFITDVLVATEITPNLFSKDMERLNGKK